MEGDTIAIAIFLIVLPGETHLKIQNVKSKIELSHNCESRFISWLRSRVFMEKTRLLNDFQI
ncbi:MAG: hypothetical protein HC874_25065 [Richelia sp. SL_2_1]|nr:hypothetical protein [Richelia sp. SL_2_1]